MTNPTALSRLLAALPLALVFLGLVLRGLFPFAGQGVASQATMIRAARAPTFGDPCAAACQILPARSSFMVQPKRRSP